MMMTEICQELRNWFEKDRYIGKVSINGNNITVNGKNVNILTGQYFRIIGSVFNDGVHIYPSSYTVDETFDGAVWLMAVPPAVISLATEIDSWQTKYGGVDSVNMSPFNSESFGGYSYSKSGGGSSDASNAGAGTWQSVYAKRLNAWRKV